MYIIDRNKICFKYHRHFRSTKFIRYVILNAWMRLHWNSALDSRSSRIILKYNAKTIVDNDHITRHVYKEWLEIYLNNATRLGRSGTKVAVWTVVVKPVIHYRSIVNLLWRVFFRSTTFCGRVFSQTTLDSIIQPNAIWKRRVQSVLLAGSGFPVFIRTGKTAGQISGPYPCNVKNGYVHFRLRLIPEVRT